MDTKSFLRMAVATGLVATLFIPLIVSTVFFFPFITGKNFAFRIIVELTFAFWLLLCLKDATVRPRWNLLLYALGGFIISLGISAFFAENPYKAFWSNFERMEGWLALVHLGAYFVVLASMLRSEKLWKIFLNTSIVVSVIIGLYGVLQLSGVFTINQGGVRVDGTLGNATYFAVYMLFHAFFTLLALYKWGRNSIPLQVWYGFALVLQIVMIFYSATRGTAVGLLAGLFTTGLILLLFGKGHPGLRKAGIAAVVGLVIAVSGFVAIKDATFIQQSPIFGRLASISFSELETRLTIWGMAYQGFQERPIFGWGQEGFNYVFNKYYQPSLYAQEQWFDRAHNAFIDWLMAGGIIGFLFYLSLYLLAVWYLIRPNPMFPLPERAILAGLLAGYALNNSLVFDNLTSYMFFLALLAYITYRTEESPVSSAPALPPAKVVSPPMFTAASAGVALVTAAVFYFVNVPGIAAASGLLDALRSHPEGLQKNFEVFKDLSRYQGLGRQEIREQIIQFAAQVRRSNGGDEAFQNEVATFAVEEMQKELESNPDDARLVVFFGSFLRQFGSPDTAVQVLSRASELSPKKQTIMLEVGITYHDQGNFTEAMKWFKKAYDLDPRYETPLTFYAVAALQNGDRALAESLLMERYGTVTPDSDFLIQAYVTIKDFQSVIEILKKRVLADPSNPQPHIQLSSAYLQLGDRQSAIAEVRKAIELDPALKAEGEQYIQEIEAGGTP